MKFCTVLHTLNSPKNVGMIIRSHVAHDGGVIIFTGHEKAWQFNKGSNGFSRNLQQLADIKHIPKPMEAIEFLKQKGFIIVALEISERAENIHTFEFPEPVAIVLGNEGEGLPKPFLECVDHIVTIPQYGAAASLNVAVSASIAMYELCKNRKPRPVGNDEFI